MNDKNLEQTRNQLHGDDSLQRFRAIRAIAAQAPDATELIPDLYELCSSSNRPTASGAWAAIGRYKSSAVPFLLQLLESKVSRERQDSIDLLLELGFNRTTWRILGQILDDRPNSMPDWGKYEAEVVKRLNTALADDDRDVRVSAAAALDEINQVPERLIDVLMDGLKSNDITTQNVAALHLGRLGKVASAAIPALRGFVERNTDPQYGTRRPVLAATNSLKRILGKT